MYLLFQALAQLVKIQANTIDEQEAVIANQGHSFTVQLLQQEQKVAELEATTAQLEATADKQQRIIHQLLKQELHTRQTEVNALLKVQFEMWLWLFFFFFFVG